MINKFGKNGIEIIKVVKLVFLADVYALRNYSMLVSDDKYVAMNNGPVGSEIYDILTKNIEWLEDEKIVYIQKFLKSDWKNTFSRIFSKQNADENHLSIMGKEVLDKIFVEFGNKTPNELIDLSHEFHAWKKHNITNSDNLSAKIDMIDLFENDGCLKVSAEDIRCAKIAYEH